VLSKVVQPTGLALRPAVLAALTKVTVVCGSQGTNLPCGELCLSTPPNVLRAGYRLKMAGVDARPVVAKVVDLEAVGDRPNEILVVDAVGALKASISRQVAVAVSGL
jgi:hypothetical protein